MGPEGPGSPWNMEHIGFLGFLALNDMVSIEFSLENDVTMTSLTADLLWPLTCFFFYIIRII